MAEKDFAIVCDDTCDLPEGFLGKARVRRVRLDAPDRGTLGASSALEAAYRELAGDGFERVISIHSSASFSPVVLDAREAAASCGDVADVRVVDSGAASAATGMLIDRAARYRHLGVAFEDAVAGLEALASHVRLLVVPAPSSRLASRRSHRTRGGLIGRAAATLRVRMTGERGLYLLSQGNVTQLARNNDVDVLARRLARAVAAVSENEGSLVHALTASKNVRALRAVERALAESGAVTRCLGTVHASALTEETFGQGSVAVAMAPESVYCRDEAALAGLGSRDAAPTGIDEQNEQNRRIP